MFGKDVNRSLRRSAVRRNALLYLLLLGTASIADIAKGIHSNYTNVRLAIEGDGDRYAMRLSLIKLGLVDREAITGDLCVYRLTPMGESVAKVLEELGYDRDFKLDQEV